MARRKRIHKIITVDLVERYKTEKDLEILNNRLQLLIKELDEGATIIRADATSDTITYILAR